MKRFLVILNLGTLALILKFAVLLGLWELPEKFSLTAFDVGQGDALLITIPQTTVQILIDGGPDEKVVDGLRKHLPAGDDLVDVVILTHGHEDHVKGLLSVLENFSVGVLVDTGAETENANQEKLLEQADLLEIPLLYAARGEKIKVGADFWLEILHPFYSKGLEYLNLNNASVVAAVNYEDERILLVGDLEVEGEEEIFRYLEKKGKLNLLEAGTLKVGHHGSKTATSEKLLDLVKPRQAIISCGKGNKFKHPHKETLDKLREREIEIRRTDEEGEVKIERRG